MLEWSSFFLVPGRTPGDRLPGSRYHPRQILELELFHPIESTLKPRGSGVGGGVRVQAYAQFGRGSSPCCWLFGQSEDAEDAEKKTPQKDIINEQNTHL